VDFFKLPEGLGKTLLKVKKSHIIMRREGLAMLIRFNVGNFLSFNKIQEFSMLGGKVRSKTEHLDVDRNLKLLKFAAVFGANASGKSNLVSAMDFAKEMVINGLPDGHTSKYFRLSKANKDELSYFEFEVKINNKYYAYGFEVVLNKSSIINEWLYEIFPDNRQENLFIRNERNIDIGDYFNSRKERLEIYAEDIKGLDSVLFLSEMNRNKSELYKEESELSVLKDIYDWIERQLDINYPDRPFSNYSYFMTDNQSDEIIEIISAFGTGITNFKIVDTNIDELMGALPKEMMKDIFSKFEKKVLKAKKNADSENDVGMLIRGNREFFILERDDTNNIKIKTILFEHGKNEAMFNLSEESDGTIRMLELIEILLASNNNKVYVIDEIDRSLHPQLTYKFIETFLKTSKTRQMQLIVTTHESRLLDFDLLRRDEIWFVDKNKSGESSVYSLDVYNERFDKRIDKAYLEGRYGGVPIFSTVFPVREE
jgi:AAA15 family ATPase/GTPase